MGSSYLKYYRASRAHIESPTKSPIVEDQSDDEDDYQRNEDRYEQAGALPPTAGFQIGSKLVIGGGVLLVLLVLIWFFVRHMRSGGGVKNKRHGAPEEDGDETKTIGTKNIENMPFPADKMVYECDREGKKTSPHDCQRNLNCMWLYDGYNVDNGICTHRVLRPSPTGGCKTLQAKHACNMRNDRCIWKQGKCMVRPL